MSTRFGLAVLWAGSVLAAAPAQADVITLRGGNTIRGLVLEHKSTDREVHLLTARGELSVAAAQVTAIDQPPDISDRYRDALGMLKGGDAAGHYELALWCEAAGLDDESRAQLDAVLRLEPDHAGARRLLGFVRRDGTWTRIDQAAASQVAPATDRAPSAPAAAEPARGSSSAPPEADAPILPDPGAAQAPGESLAQRRARWERELTRIIKQLDGGSADQARDQLEALRDPMAVSPIVKAMSSSAEPLRMRLLSALGHIAGPEATAALGFIAVADTSPDLRWGAIEQLRGRQRQDYRPALVAALRSNNREAIFNAAEAATELGELALAPQLIGALTTDARNTYVRSGFVSLTQTWVPGTKLEERDLPLMRT